MTAAELPAASGPVDAVLARLEGVRRNGAGWSARCPAHEDRSPSLSIGTGADGRALLTCHAGCSLDAILAELRVEAGDLFTPSIRRRLNAPGGRRSPARQDAGQDAASRAGGSDDRRAVANGATPLYKAPGGRPAQLYTVRDPAGELAAIHVRRDGPRGKRMSWRRPDGSTGLGGRRADSLPLYGSEQLRAWDTSRPVIVAEGEKAAQALLTADIPALGTVTGAHGAPSADVLRCLSGRHVILWPDADADAAGAKHMQRVAERLEGVAASVRLLAWPDAPEGGDAADAIDAGADVAALIAAAVPMSGAAPAPDAAPEAWPEPEDRGAAVLSELGGVEYVEDLILPGRIVVVAAEEGTGKSYAISGELAIRVAVAGGAFACTWPIRRTGPALVLSEMHPDDDYAREAAILAALELERDALAGRYYRLPLASAAGDRPALQVPEWREWIAGWLRDRGALLAVFDTATGAAQVDPWGGDIQGVYRGLRVMLEHYPELAIVLIVHLKKPSGRGERQISDVLGEWGRWCDVLLLLERDGATRVKLSTRKRVRHERRIVATKRDGLLIDPQDLSEGPAPKVPLSEVVAAIEANPGIGAGDLAQLLGVGRSTAQEYAQAAARAGLIDRRQEGPRGAFRLYPPSDRPASSGEAARTVAGQTMVRNAERLSDRPTDLYRSDSRPPDGRGVPEGEQLALDPDSIEGRYFASVGDGAGEK